MESFTITTQPLDASSLEFGNVPNALPRFAASEDDPAQSGSVEMKHDADCMMVVCEMCWVASSI
jgi:hypothetical protein